MSPGVCQVTQPPQGGTVPIYRVEVVERTVKAINYQYRSGPTKIDFGGTVLLTDARGEAEVDSKQGRTEIDAKFENLAPPTRFGREYLTYVLWAVTPEGRPHNLGEVVADGSNKAKLRVTTDLQAFGLIVTAEPYWAVRQPGDVVVLENRVRSDTVGQIKEIHVRYELMPRGMYTWHVTGKPAASDAPKLSQENYEAVLELYQAQNAIGIARAANADRYAPNTFAAAQRLLDEARQLQDIRAGASRVVQSAREATQTAEDARLIASRRQQEEKLSGALAEAEASRRAKSKAEARMQQAEAEARAARAQTEAERTARRNAEADAAAARGRAARLEAEANRARVVVSAPRRQEQEDARKTGLRMRMLEQLNGVLPTRDTPRGLVATIPDSGFSGPAPRDTTYAQAARIAAIAAAQPGLRVEVQGHPDSAAGEGLSWKRAQAMRDALVRHGLREDAVSARGLGDSRPLVHPAGADARMRNQRVEIVISGDPIGTLPFWDRAYVLAPR